MSATRNDLAAKELTALREQPGFDESVFIAWDLGSFADRFCISTQEAADILRNTRPAPDKSRFQWLEAVTQACGRGQMSQKGVLVANVLFGCFNDSSPYCWPSQQTIAKRAGWTSIRAVTYGLSQLSELGAIERILARNLPVDVAEKVLGAKEEGGSGRDVRSAAYKRVPPSVWQKVEARTECSTNNRNSSFHLNHKTQPEPASPDTPYLSVEASPLASPLVETYQYGSDGEKAHG